MPQRYPDPSTVLARLGAIALLAALCTSLSTATGLLFSVNCSGSNEAFFNQLLRLDFQFYPRKF